MAKNITTTSATVRPLSEANLTLIKLASRKQGVTRAEVREALGYEAGANIAVQTMLKKLAARAGLLFVPVLVESTTGRKIAEYRFAKPASASAKRSARAPVEVAPAAAAKGKGKGKAKTA